MKRWPVTSSNIHSVGYDEVKKCLEIEFLDGTVYQYGGVEKGMYDAMRAASSAGKYFHNNIKRQFVGQKMTPAHAPNRYRLSVDPGDSPDCFVLSINDHRFNCTQSELSSLLNDFQEASLKMARIK